ncbi:MAG: orotate phosphoribosyltransferase [Hyphomonadaceae bacterium]|nr:orotate phosphoribosyltransferase [Hyphomonadaceae bacterium]
MSNRLRELIRERSFATGDFTLASGKKSNLYFNLKPTMMLPEGAYLMGEAFLDKVSDAEADYVGGLEMGAVPIIAAMAALAHERKRRLRAFFVRKKAKEHGARALIEGLAPGESLAGKRIVMAEDVTTTGGSVLQAIEAAREAGGECRLVVTILDRNEGARETLAQHGIELRAVLTAADFT